MPLPLGPLFLAGATAAIGYFFQENSAKNARHRKETDAEIERTRQFREAELTRAKEIYENTSNSLSDAYVRFETLALCPLLNKEALPGSEEAESADEQNKDLAHLMLLATARPTGEEWRTEYQKAFHACLDLKGNLPRVRGMVKQYFGDDNAGTLSNIVDTFPELLFRYHRATTAKKTLLEVGYHSQLDGQSNQIEKLVRQMLKQIQDQTVGSLRGGTRS